MKSLIRLSCAMLLACVIGVCMSGCAEAEEGESWGDWEFRNAISNSKWTSWHIIQIKDENGNWVNQDDNTILYFDIQFFVNDHNFHSTKFYWTQDKDEGWISDDATREEYKPSNNTAFTIDSKNLIIEGTIGEEKYFRFNLNKKVEGSMEGKLYFYRDNKTYEVIMSR